MHIAEGLYGAIGGLGRLEVPGFHLQLDALGLPWKGTVRTGGSVQSLSLMLTVQSLILPPA